MDVFVILNPVAGRSQPEEVRIIISAALDRAGHHAEFYETTGEEQVGQLVDKAVTEGAQLVVAAGGDGTVSSVVDGLAHTGIPLAIIPTGTGNVVAQELGIPLRTEKAAQLIVSGSAIRPIDALKVEGRYFILSVGTGLDALTIEKTDRQYKRRLGPFAYVIGMPRVLVGLQPREFTVVADGVTRRYKAADVLVTNVGTLTRPLRWGPHIRPDDGKIDICIIRATSLLDVLGVALDIVAPFRSRRDRNLRYWSAHARVMVSADRPMPVQGDGDILGKTPVDIEIVPSAINVLIPEKDKRLLRERLRERVRWSGRTD